MTEKLPPCDAVRAYCTQCQGMKQFNAAAVRECEGDKALNGPCPLFHYRLGKRPPVKLFRKFCLDCTQGSVDYVADCPAESCPCYPYRFGKNPALVGKRKASKEGIEALQKYRDSYRDGTRSSLKSVFLP